MAAMTESTVESSALAWLSELGWRVRQGSKIAPDGLCTEGQDYGQVVLEQRLRDTPLPKLISGKIRVNDAERFLKERGL